MIVTCVEAGYLESQTLRMIESLRNWGGQIGQLPVFAVTPRFGPLLQKSTLLRYEQLNVTHLKVKSTSKKYAWYNFTNKPAALLASEEKLKVEQVIWLDADLLIVSEPTDLLLGDGDDFTACPTDKNIGTTGPDDPYNPYWLAMCAAMGMSLEDVPWVSDFRSNERMRMYFNSGVFTYRPETGFAEAFRQATEQIMDAKIQLPKDGIFYHEQAALGLAAVKQKVRIKILAEACNYPLGSMTLEHMIREKLLNASVLHYHRSMQKDRWDQFLPLIEANHPKLLPWLSPKGPLDYSLPPVRRFVGKIMREYRKRKADAYKSACRTV